MEKDLLTRRGAFRVTSRLDRSGNSSVRVIEPDVAPRTDSNRLAKHAAKVAESVQWPLMCRSALEAAPNYS